MLFLPGKQKQTLSFFLPSPFEDGIWGLRSPWGKFLETSLLVVLNGWDNYRLNHLLYLLSIFNYLKHDKGKKQTQTFFRYVKNTRRKAMNENYVHFNGTRQLEIMLP